MTFGNKVLQPWRKTMLPLWVLRLFKSLGSSAIRRFGYCIRPPEKGTAEAIEKWWEIRKQSEFALGVRSIFRGQVVSFRDRMEWDTPWKINMKPQNEGLVQNGSDDFPCLL